MKMPRLSVSLVFLVGCAVGGASSRLVAPIPPAHAGAPTTRWEYYCVSGKPTPDMNAVGAQGWELATGIAAVTGSVTNSEITYCFKRPLP